MKEQCINHPDKKAIAPCHSCEKYFCYDCLNEGKEYYYCNQEQCQVKLREENIRFNETEETEEKKKIYSEQRWKENSRRLYRKAILILSTVGLLLIFLFFLSDPFPYVGPILIVSLVSFRLLVGLLFWIWLIRITVYKYLIWEKKILKEWALNQNQGQTNNQDQSIEKKQEKIAKPFYEQSRRVSEKLAKIFGWKIY